MERIVKFRPIDVWEILAPTEEFAARKTKTSDPNSIANVQTPIQALDVNMSLMPVPTELAKMGPLALTTADQTTHASAHPDTLAAPSHLADRSHPLVS